MFRTFDDVLTHLDTLGLFHVDLGLDRVRRAAAALGFERAAAPVVQVVGTNGKGSTATFLASLALAHGLKVGLHTSPHFVTPRERIRIDGAMLPPDLWTELASEVHAAAPDLTYFEFLTVLSFAAFARSGVDVMIMEAGLGGRYDATTALKADLVCYTPIALDHERVLGTTVSAVAEDKSGAVRPAKPVLSGPQPPEALQVLKRAAAAVKAPFLNARDVAELPPGVRLGLVGPHQRDNARLALAAWTLLARENGWSVEPHAVARGLGKAHIAGRLQGVPAVPERGDPPFLLDGAHNPHGLSALRTALRAAEVRPGAVIFSCLADKNVEAMLPLVREIADGAPLFVPSIQDNERAVSGEELASRCGAVAVPRLHAALEAVREQAARPGSEFAEKRPVLVCGSLYLLGEFFTLRPQWLE